jgi:mRNA interferase HigB
VGRGGGAGQQANDMALSWSQFGTIIQAMRVIAVSTLKTFWEQPIYRDAEQPLKAWFEEVSHANWRQPADIKAQYGNASILKNRRVVFNIKGNDYRLVVAVSYKMQLVFVKFVGTHRAYDAIDAETIELA